MKEDKKQRSYIAIDLKSFYASVECADRDLDPLDANLVVADAERTEKTICLAVSPSLKSWGVPGRPRLFEVVQKVKEINALRLEKAPGHRFTGKSCFHHELIADPSLELDYIVAVPRMAHYMRCSTAIYQTYLKYIAPEDIHVYSIDEVFIDATDYLRTYGMSAHELAMTMIRDVLGNTGITATAGIGTNLYLSKIAMDIVAKKMPPDRDGVRIAELDEMSYRRQLWTHRPLTDFWRVGRGYASKLEQRGIYTMGDIARCSLGRPSDYHNEQLLYDLFGINAELLVDHAWGWEPCTMKDIKSYRSESSSLSTGQVLEGPYRYDKALLIAKEMAEVLSMDLVAKDLVTKQIVLTVGYDVENLAPDKKGSFTGELTADNYGRLMPRQAHGSINLSRYTSSTEMIMEAVAELFSRIVDRNLTVRRMYVVAAGTITEDMVPKGSGEEQLSIFTDYAEEERKRAEEEEKLKEEKQMQQAMLAIRRKYGKNAIVKGLNLEEGGTTIKRNGQVGGHRK
ncbi:MAG: DNA methylase [Firmicutes bacterium]|nr:DNA methylase [Bacillota bacterium]